MIKNMMGEDGMCWFVGVVESRQDPLALGRIQVRVYGTHTDSLTEIPSEDLPWATVIDDPLVRPKENDRVLGFWADANSKQIPIIVGILPGFQVAQNNQGAGFNDLRKSAILQNAPRKPESLTYQKDGSGIKIKEASAAKPYPLQAELQAPTLSGATRYEIGNTVIQSRKTNLDTGIVTANGITWSEPYPAYNPLYPYNKALETESGHLIEFDDTPGNERICFTHRSGSFSEFYPSGSRVDKVTKSHYEIVMGDDFVHIMGKAHITVGAGSFIRVIGDANIEVDNNVNMGVGGQMNLSVGEALNIKAKSMNIDIENDATTVTGGSQFLTASGDIHASASGDAFLTSGGQMEMFAGGPIDMLGSDFTTQVSAGSATPGSAAGIPAAPGIASPNSGEASKEKTPVPFQQYFKHLDAYTGAAYKHSLFQNDDGSQPALANVPPCNFDSNTKIFIPSSQWSLSAAGANALKQREGFAKKLANGSCQAYPDPVTGGQPYTIGWGVTQAAIGETITLDTIWTLDVATAKFMTCVNNVFLPELKQTITVPLTQNMVDALLSLMYNIGTTNFAASSVRTNANAKQWCAAAAAILLYNRAAGRTISSLTTRRISERNQFLQ